MCWSLFYLANTGFPWLLNNSDDGYKEDVSRAHSQTRIPGISLILSHFADCYVNHSVSVTWQLPSRPVRNPCICINTNSYIQFWVILLALNTINGKHWRIENSPPLLVCRLNTVRFGAWSSLNLPLDSAVGIARWIIRPPSSAYKCTLTAEVPQWSQLQAMAKTISHPLQWPEWKTSHTTWGNEI